MAVAPLRSAPSDQEMSWIFAIADSLPQLVWSTRPDGYHDYFNQRFYDFTGVKPGDAKGDSWRTLFHPDDMPEADARWAASLASGEAYEIEYRMRDRTGVYRWMLGRALPLRDAGGRIIRWIGTCTDIDDIHRLRAREEVVNQELNHRIKNIFAVMGGLVRLEAREHPEAAAFADAIVARIDALGRAHSMSIGGRELPQSRSLRDILETLLAPYAAMATIEVECPADIAVGERALLPLGLALHELATNAAKHGALAQRRSLSVTVVRTPAGDVSCDWCEDNADAEAALRMTGAGQGFGSTLLKMTLENQLGARITRRADTGVLVKHILFPARNFSALT